MKKFLTSALLLVLVFLTACTDADVASRNISKAADNFEVNRRVIFYNGITDTFLLSVEGRCSLGNSDDRSTQVTVTCKVADNEYLKHSMGLSDNVTYISEQLQGVDVSTYHYNVTFKPEVILPDINLKVEALE